MYMLRYKNRRKDRKSTSSDDLYDLYILANTRHLGLYYMRKVVKQK